MCLTVKPQCYPNLESSPLRIAIIIIAIMYNSNNSNNV